MGFDYGAKFIMETIGHKNQGYSLLCTASYNKQ